MAQSLAFDLANFTTQRHAFVAVLWKGLTRAGQIAKKVANVTRLDAISPKTIRSLLLLALAVAGDAVIRIYVSASTATAAAPSCFRDLAQRSVAVAVEQGTYWAPLLAPFFIGACVTYGLGVVANALVPTAMSWFGEVVLGVGTMHAKGGVAATLQWLSTALAKPAAQAIGGGVFATLKAAFF